MNALAVCQAALANHDCAPTEAAIKQFALQNAAPYLHPRRIWLLSEMPLAGTNKIDRRALAARAAELLSQPVIEARTT
jgi:acyl-CoA synthetase (AMP-forming)/AMP-acid ligase II